MRKAGVLPVNPVFMVTTMNSKETSVTRESVSESAVRPGTRAGAISRCLTSRPRNAAL